MRRSFPILLSSPALLAAPSALAYPGFDCAKAICAWDTIGVLDGQMADAYQIALAAQDGEAALASGWPSVTVAADWSRRRKAARMA